MSVLLDTCAAIWLGEGSSLSAQALAALEEALETEDVLVSPITAWELGLLTACGRLRLAMSPQIWFARLLGLDGVCLAAMDPEVLIASSFLPGEPPNDPADRIIAATAREQDLTVITRDGRLLAYAKAGHMRALGC